VGYLSKEKTIRIVKNIELKGKGSRFFSKDLQEILEFEKELEKFQNNFGDDHLNYIYYWYKVIKDRSSSVLDSFNSEKSIDQKTSELIWGHCDEYSNRMLDETLESKIEFIKPRIKCFGFLFDKISDLHSKLSKNSEHKDIIEIITKELYNAKASLYGAVKFAFINKVSIKEIKNWYLNLIDDHSLIMGVDPFSAINKEYNLDLNETVKIYELDEEYRSQVPDWFMGPFYLEGKEVTNDQFNGVINLNPIERSIYQLITTNQKLSEGLSSSDKKIQTNPFFLEMIEKVDLGKEWFKINNQDTYQKLFPEDVLKENLVNIFIESINSNNEIYNNINQEKDLIKQQNLIKKYMLENPENYNLYNIMAYNQYDQKNYKKGISYVKIVINKDSDNAAYYDTAGLGYYYLKDFHKSLEYLNKSLELEPEGKNIAEHYYNRGRVYEALKAMSRAKRDYEKALELDESYSAAQIALNNLKS
jgi:tetratricopeptide (TPR) repeat protein